MQTIHFEGQDLRLHISEHRDGDDLLSAGLGLAGLRQPLAPPEHIDAALLRRRAIYHNWHGIADVSSDQAGWQHVLEQAQPGQEVHVLLALPGLQHGHRVMLQIPDSFDPAAPRLLATAASGSRGVYGALALASAWGLARGFAVVCTDKGCGTDCYAEDSDSAPGLDGMPTDDPALQAFRPSSRVGKPHAVQTRHVYSMDNPEQHWGDFLNQAIRFSWTWLVQQRGAAISPRCTLAAGLSNGGAAVLQALQNSEHIDAAVAVAPNICAAEGGRPFFDYLSEADQWMPLAQGAARLQQAPCPLPAAHLQAMAARAHEELTHSGRLRPMPLPQAAEHAYRHLRRRGWPAHTLVGSRICSAFDFWRPGVVAYSHALGRFAAAQSPLDCHYAMLDEQGQPRAASTQEQALWWCDGAGIVPMAGLQLVSAIDRVETLRRVRQLSRGSGEAGRRIQQGIRALRCGPPQPGIPLLLVHGEDDGLIPPIFSSLPYWRMARRHGADLQYWRIPQRPHFDAFLGLPGYGEHRRPLLPVALQALDAIWQRLQRAVPIAAWSENASPDRA